VGRHGRRAPRRRAPTAAKREKRRFAGRASRVLADFDRLERVELGEPYRRFPWIGALDAREARLGSAVFARMSASVFRRESR
jgi:hypothetical protein